MQIFFSSSRRSVVSLNGDISTSTLVHLPLSNQFPSDNNADPRRVVLLKICDFEASYLKKKSYHYFLDNPIYMSTMTQ